MAYTTATVSRNEPLPDGRARVFVMFTGDAGEPQMERDIYIDGSTTGASLKQWAIDLATSLNSARTIAKAPTLQIGQSISLVPPAPVVPPAPPAPTAKELFMADVMLLRHMNNAVSLGVLPANNSSYTTQKTNVATALTNNPAWIDIF
jgi:hypothetical protein